MTSKTINPPLKWPGGKRTVMGFINQHFPEGRRLIEPFVGGGSVLLNAGFDRNLLNDVNPDLINFYRQLVAGGAGFVEMARELFSKNSEGEYYDIREKFRARDSAPDIQAAYFLYLNRHCFNGLVRYNQAGAFNVGYGKYKAPHFPEAEMLALIQMAGLRELAFVCGDFDSVIEEAGDGDVVFCDPPYEPMPDKNGFTAYSGATFSFADQERLTRLLIAATERGARVMITNSGAPKILELYHNNGFTQRRLSARRSISCSDSGRETVSDVLAII